MNLPFEASFLERLTQEKQDELLEQWRAMLPKTIIADIKTLSELLGLTTRPHGTYGTVQLVRQFQHLLEQAEFKTLPALIQDYCYLEKQLDLAKSELKSQKREFTGKITQLEWQIKQLKPKPKPISPTLALTLLNFQAICRRIQKQKAIDKWIEEHDTNE